MERVDKTIFLSYRRTNLSWALAIYQSLTQNGYDVFFDYTGIASGDFERVILANIKSRAHFLVLLTPSALERCDHPGDWLRREIETALAYQRNTVPLLLEGFDFGTPKIASQLTGTLAALKGYSGLSIPPEYFMEAMGRLRDRYLNVPLSGVLHPASLIARQGATQQNAAAKSAPTVREEELTAQQWFERGLAALDREEKLRFYSEAIRLKPDYADAFSNRGNAQGEKGDLEGALQDYTEAIRLVPDDSVSFYNRGVTRKEKGDSEGALQDYCEAIRLKPDYSFVFVNRGALRLAKGDLEGALQDYNEAIVLNPDDAVALYNRGLTRTAKRDLAGALQDYEEAVRLKPDFASALVNRGNARRNNEELDRAVQDYNEAIRLRPNDAIALENRGFTRRLKGDLDGALSDYNEAIRLKPDYASAFHNRGIVRRDKGDLAGANEDFSKARSLNAASKT